MPVDPGAHRIAARAPKKQPWEARVDTARGNPVRIDVPRLDDPRIRNQKRPVRPLAARDRPDLIDPAALEQHPDSRARNVLQVRRGLNHYTAPSI